MSNYCDRDCRTFKGFLKNLDYNWRMNESPIELPNLKTEAWREKQKLTFKHHFQVAMADVARVLGEKEVPENRIFEWYDPSIAGAYFIHGSSRIGVTLGILEITWSVLTGNIDRHLLIVSQKGAGFGSKINLITEQLGRKLGANKLTLSAITNDRWKKKLLADGFVQDPRRPDQVFKML